MKINIPVDHHIHRKLKEAGLEHDTRVSHVSVDADSYAHFLKRIATDYTHISSEEQHALAVSTCLTHPDHRDKQKTPRIPIVKVKTWPWHFWLIIVIALAMALLFTTLARCQGTSQIDVITFQDAAGVPIKSFAAPFKIKCSTNVTCAASGSVLTVTASGGGAGGYATVQNAGVAIAAEPVLNFLGALACVDNAGNTSSDCKISANIAVAHQFLTGIDANGNFTRAQPDYSDLTGTPTLPATKLAVGSNWINSYDATTGLFTATRPTYSDITSLPQLAQTKFAVANKFLTEYNASNGLFQFAQPASTNLSDFSAVAASHTGMLPIWDQPSTTYIPGDPIITGPDANGAAPSGNPVVTAGWDGTNVRRVKTDTAGVVQVNVTGLNVACSGLPALVGDVTSSSGSCTTAISPTVSLTPKKLDGVIFADSYNLGDWAADVNAAVAEFGNKYGTIKVSKAGGLFASAPVALHGNMLQFTDDADYTSKGISIDQGGGGIRGMGLSNAGSSVFGTRLVFTGTAATDAITITGTSIARLDKNVLEGFICDANNTARYCLRTEKADGGTARDVRFQGAQTAGTYVVDAIDWKYYNVGWTFCQGNTGAGYCAIWDWGSGNTAIFGGQTEQGAASTNPQFVFSGAINTFAITGMDMDALFAVGGFILVQGQDANSAFAGAPTGGTGKPINVTFSHSLISTTVNPAQGADILVNGTATNQPSTINIHDDEFNGASASAVAIKADQANNVNIHDIFSNGHTTATVSATANSSSVYMSRVNSLDTARTTGTTASITDTPAVFNLRTTADFVTAANANLQAITGLSWVMPPNTVRQQAFDCYLMYSQQTAAVAADAFGIQAASLAPTQINAQGHVELTVGPPSTFNDGNLVALTTTTATNIVAFTASAITTVFNAELHGMIENPSGVANTINIMVKTGTAADTMTVKRGSYCLVH